MLVRDRPSVFRSTKCIAHAHPVVDFRAGFQGAMRSDKHPCGGNRVAGCDIQLAKLLANRTRPAGKPIQEPLAKGVGSHIPKRRYEVEIDYVVGVVGHKPLDVFGAHGSRSALQQFPDRGFNAWHRLLQSHHFARLPGPRLSSQIVIKVTTDGAPRQPANSAQPRRDGFPASPRLPACVVKNATGNIRFECRSVTRFASAPIRVEQRRLLIGFFQQEGENARVGFDVTLPAKDASVRIHAN